MAAAGEGGQADDGPVRGVSDVDDFAHPGRATAATTAGTRRRRPRLARPAACFPGACAIRPLHLRAHSRSLPLAVASARPALAATTERPTPGSRLNLTPSPLPAQSPHSLRPSARPGPNAPHVCPPASLVVAPRLPSTSAHLHTSSHGLVRPPPNGRECHHAVQTSYKQRSQEDMQRGRTSSEWGEGRSPGPRYCTYGRTSFPSNLACFSCCLHTHAPPGLLKRLT